jgi:hypothetical protein
MKTVTRDELRVMAGSAGFHRRNGLIRVEHILSRAIQQRENRVHG